MSGMALTEQQRAFIRSGRQLASMPTRSSVLSTSQQLMSVGPVGRGEREQKGYLG
jgi:hypothetical protein